MLADYHVHTEFSDDSDELMEHQLARGCELGLDEICFTDHVDYGIKKDWAEGNLPMRGGDGVSIPKDQLRPIANVDYPRYFEKISRLQREWAGRITIKKGLELGVQTITVEKNQKLFDRYRHELDFILLSMHQVDNKEFWTGDFQHGRTQREYTEAYYMEIYETMRAFRDFSCLSHLDLIVRYSPEPHVPFKENRDLIAAILEEAIKGGHGIELNTSSWHYGLKDTMPSRDILRLYKDLGGTVLTIGSDAHWTKYLADHMKDAREILSNEIGFKYFCTFDKMQPKFHRFE